MNNKFLVIVCIGISLNTIAQDSAMLSLDPVTVSATLQPVPASRTGRNILTIPGDYFNKLPVHSIDDLLRYVPGVEVQMRGPGGSQSDIVLRGGTFQQVLVILDGMRLNDPNSGHFSSYIPIVPSEIDRIEVLKGASSAIYGSEAVGGVIHIITKAFAARINSNKKEIALSGVTGEYGLFNASAGGLFQKNKIIVSGGVLTNNSEGQQQRGSRGSFHNTTASLSAKQFIGEKWSVAFRSSLDQRRFAAQNFYTTFISDTANEKVTTYWNQAAISYHNGKHSVNLDAGYKAVTDIYQYNPGSTANNNRSTIFQAVVTDHFRVSNKTIISTGVQLQDRQIRSNDRGNHTVNRLAGFMILNQQLDAFSVSPSLRVDYNESRGTELVPQLNLAYTINKLQWRASVGKTIRDADFTEQYNNYNKAFVSGGSVGNPNLLAESSFSYEAGADYFVSKSFKFSATVFQRRQSQLIDWITTSYNEMPRKDNLSPTGTYALAKNISKVTTSGAEVDILFNKSLIDGSRILTTLGLLWLESKSDNAAPSFYISSHARFLSNMSAEYQHKHFSISMTALYKNRKAAKAVPINAVVDKDVFLLNAKGTLFLFNQRFSLFAELDNVFDNRFSDLLGTRVPGRWFMAGFAWRL